jgi:hypothetical protein
MSKLLMDCTNKEIKDYADSLGYDFSNEDCIEIRRAVAPFHNPGEETLEEAVNDFLNAYER